VDLSTFTEELFTKITALGDRNWQLDALGQGQVVVDRQRLTQALTNLAQNATQYTEITDTIAFGSSLGENLVRFWLRDTGKGIAPKDQKRIFQRFARGVNSRSVEGTGLGLAMVQAIVEAHNGWVELYSQLDIGATFTIIIPLKPA
jgi:signal transduction histidine kinase